MKGSGCDGPGDDRKKSDRHRCQRRHRQGDHAGLCARGRRRRDLRPPQGAARSHRGRDRQSDRRKIFAIPADLTKPADAENFIKKAHAALGRIDILVNNAGSSPGGVIEHLTEEDWAQSLQLKFMGYVRCMKHVLPIMRQQKKGRVVNLIGNDGVKVSYWEIAPGAANAAGQNLTLSLASQYGRDNISFVAVNPGPVRTERWTGLVKAMARDMKLPFEEADKRGAVEHPARPHRRMRRGRQPRHLSGVGSRLFHQRHHDRDRRRPGQGADGQAARSLKNKQTSSRYARGTNRDSPGRGMTLPLVRRRLPL